MAKAIEPKKTPQDAKAIRLRAIHETLVAVLEINHDVATQTEDVRELARVLRVHYLALRMAESEAIDPACCIVTNADVEEWSAWRGDTAALSHGRRPGHGVRS